MTISAESVDALPRAFVVGCQKSGTSWMQALLAGHPEACSRGEACFGGALIAPLFQLLSGYNTRQRAGEINTFQNKEAIEVARAAVCSLQRRWVASEGDPSRVRVVAEKTPEHAVVLELLGAVFPTMRVIHIVRDGRDGVVSGWHHNIRENELDFRKRFPTMAAYARYFVEHHWLPYITRAREWGAANPERYREIRYEDALDAPLDHARELFEFLGVDAAEDVAVSVVEHASFRSMSGGRERGETDNASHMRRGKAGSWREELDDESVQAFESLGGHLLDKLGYERSGAMAG